MTMTTTLLTIIIVGLVANAIIQYMKPRGMSFSQFAGATKKNQSFFSNWDFSSDRSLAILQTIFFTIIIFFCLMGVFTPNDTLCFNKHQVISKRSYWIERTKRDINQNKYREKTHYYDVVIDIDGEKYEKTYEKTSYDYISGKLCFEKINIYTIYCIVTISMCLVFILSIAFSDRYIMDKKTLNEIAKLVISNDFDLNLYDFNQIEWYKIPETLERADQKTKILEEISSETIKAVVKLPVTEKDKTSPFYLRAKDEGEELKYMPWGYEIYIKADGFISYEDGAGEKMYYPNSLEIMKILKDNGYPLI